MNLAYALALWVILMFCLEPLTRLIHSPDNFQTRFHYWVYALTIGFPGAIVRELWIRLQENRRQRRWEALVQWAEEELA